MSKISFCNKTVVRKDITRFFPLWLAYLVLVILYFPAAHPYWADTQVSFARWLFNQGEGFSILNVGYAILVALFLFGGLFRSRSAYMLGAYPIRRETWFGSHVLSGLLVSLIPNAIAGLGCLLMPNAPAGAVGLWFLTLTLEYVFVFGVTAVAVSCTGNVIGAGILTSLLLLGLSVAEQILRFWLTPLIYGLRPLRGSLWLIRISPIFWFFNDTLISYSGYWDAPQGASFTDYLSVSWLHMGILLAVCLGLLALALILFRKRPTESAGDLLSFSLLKKVFPYVFGLYFGLLFGSILLDCLNYQGDANIWQRNYAPVLLCLIGTAAVGFFAGSMLLHKSFRVFRLRNFLSAAALAAVLGTCVLCCRFDWFGIADRIPEQEQVDSVALYSTVITDEDEIAEVLALHKILIEEREELQDRNESRYHWNTSENWDAGTSAAIEQKPYMEDYSPVDISYTLKNGKTLTRRYWLYSAVNLPLPQDLGLRLNRLLNTMEHQEERLFDGFPYLNKQEDPWGYLENKVYYISATGFDPVEYVPVGSSQALSLECLPELLEAIRADMAEENFEESYDYSYVPDGKVYDVTRCNLSLEYEIPYEYGDSPIVSLRITERAAHTLACLEAWGFSTPE